MPTTIDLLKGHSETLVTGIYIARGDDTLGPYNSAEAAALVLGGYLHPADHAARNGDAAWVPLAAVLAPDFAPRAEPPPAAPESVPHPGRETHGHRWRRLSAAFAVLLAVPLLVAGGARWWENRHAATDRASIQAPFAPSPAPTPSASPAVVVEERPAAPLPTPAEPDGPLRGSISLTPADGSRTSLAGLRVMAYPLAALETSLAPAATAAQTASERLDPQIEAAATERSVRATEEQAALQAWRDAAPADPMRPSLRFAYTGAKTAAQTARDNYRYLLDERTASAGGEAYLRDLPAPTVAADTDDGGGFTLELPKDDTPYAVVACARPTTDDGSTHPRYWFVKLSPAQRSGREPLRLDGGNLTSSAAPESLVHTAD